jgi:hypothetical protein
MTGAGMASWLDQPVGAYCSDESHNASEVHDDRDSPGGRRPHTG